MRKHATRTRGGAGQFQPSPLPPPPPPPTHTHTPVDPSSNTHSPIQLAAPSPLPPRHPAWLVGGPLPSAPGGGGGGGGGEGGGGGAPLPAAAWALLRSAPPAGATLTACPAAGRLAGAWSLKGLVREKRKREREREERERERAAARALTSLFFFFFFFSPPFFLQAARYPSAALPACTLLAGTPHGPPELLPLDPALNGPGAPYRVRCPRASPVTAGGGGGAWRLGGAAAAAAAWGATPALVRAPLLPGGALPPASAVLAAAARAAPDPLAACGADPAAAVAACLDWAWIESVTAAAGWGPPLAASLLAGGAAGAVCPAAWDPHHPRLLLCLGGGTARMLVTTPGDALARAYPFPLHHPHAGASMVRWADPDCGAWPAFAGLRCLSATLRCGDVGVVPPGAMAHIELVPGGGGGGTGGEEGRDGCVLLVVVLAPAPPPPRPPLPPPPLALARPPATDAGALAVRAVLHAEAVLASALGIERVRPWLAAVGRGAAPPPTSAAAAGGAGLPAPLDLGTVRGAAIAGALSSAAAALALAAGGSGEGGAALARLAVACRLRPTPWCDEGGGGPPADPLLLADAAAGWPLRFAIDLTEEEAAYPELFRRAVAAKKGPEGRGAALPAPARGWGRLGLGGWGNGGEGGGGVRALLPAVVGEGGDNCRE